MSNDNLRDQMRRDLEKLDQAERRRLKGELEKRMPETWEASVKAARGEDDNDVE